MHIELIEFLMSIQLLAAETSFWLKPESYFAMLKMAAGLGFVVFVHELGHFAVAKACGVKCEKFYVGFDFFDIKIGNVVIIPRSLPKFQWGETEYGIGIIPLGGYVKMLGQDDNPSNAEAEKERVKIRKNAAGEVIQDGGQATDASEAASETASDTDESQLSDAVNETVSELAPPATQSVDEDEYELDPRSYQAKSVPQRMAIISAGVIMNLIFAVVFASIAYTVGVPYQTCEIGAVVPGGAAWEAGVPSGGKIVSLDNSGIREHLRYTWDLRNAVGMATTSGKLKLTVRDRDGELKDFELQPRATRIGKVEMPTIGIVAAHEPEIIAAFKYSQAGQAKPEVKEGDQAISVQTSDGEKYEIKGKDDFYPLRAFMAKHIDKEVTFGMKRKKPDTEDEFETIQVKVAPNKMRRIGLVMKPKAITGVRPGAPADGKLKKGDVILEVAGQTFTDPLALETQLRGHWGEEIEVKVRRGKEGDAKDASAEEVTVKITPETPEVYEERFFLGAPISAESIGIVMPVTNIIAAVTPGSPAETAGLKAGDKIDTATFKLPDTIEDEERARMPTFELPVELDEDNLNWTSVVGGMQIDIPGVKLTLNYDRNGAKKEATVTPVDIDGQFVADRGFFWKPKTDLRTAESFTEAIYLGLRETKEDVLKVVGMVVKLVTGQIAVTNLGGPGTIFVVGTSEAGVGTARLLIFLTFLSANLAVVNFLPIPVLDGGHMVFLLWEGVLGKPMNEVIAMRLTLAGLAFILGLMALVLSLDVFRFTGLFGI